MKVVRAMRIGIGVLGMVAIGTWGVPAWAQGGAGEVGSSGGGTGSSGGATTGGGAAQKSQDMMHQERMQQGFEKDQGDQQQKQGETSLEMGQPDRNDQSNPDIGGKNIPNDQKRGK
ncbi:MAG TPA: hypothetical protein VFA38_11280 [Nitrospirales bacterium]|nr:hypothetical protein [Nitrospirales bacterium]